MPKLFDYFIFSSHEKKKSEYFFQYDKFSFRISNLLQFAKNNQIKMFYKETLDMISKI